MKLFFMSDIHGSLFYLKKGLEAFHKEEADYLVLIGDLLYHGPRNPLPKDYNPMEVAKELNSYKHKILAVRGNCDSEVDAMVLEFFMQADYAVIMNENRRIFLTHGHVFSEDQLNNMLHEDIVVQGHTHIPLANKKENYYIFNPGSIALPKDGYPNSYGIIEGKNWLVKDLEGNTIMSANWE